MKSIYLIGSLKNAEVLTHAQALERMGYDVFADWLAAGPDADDYLRDHFRALGRNYREVLSSYAARNIFEFDKKHLNRVDIVGLIMPAGKSGHLELGYAAGLGKETFIMMDKEPERVDIMHQFADQVFLNPEEMYEYFSEGKANNEAPDGSISRVTLIERIGRFANHEVAHNKFRESIEELNFGS